MLGRSAQLPLILLASALALLLASGLIIPTPEAWAGPSVREARDPEPRAIGVLQDGSLQHCNYLNDASLGYTLYDTKDEFPEVGSQYQPMADVDAAPPATTPTPFLVQNSIAMYGDTLYFLDQRSGDASDGNDLFRLTMQEYDANWRAFTRSNIAEDFNLFQELDPVESLYLQQYDEQLQQLVFDAHNVTGFAATREHVAWIERLAVPASTDFEYIARLFRRESVQPVTFSPFIPSSMTASDIDIGAVSLSSRYMLTMMWNDVSGLPSIVLYYLDSLRHEVLHPHNFLPGALRAHFAPHIVDVFADPMSEFPVGQVRPPALPLDHDVHTMAVWLSTEAAMISRHESGAGIGPDQPTFAWTEDVRIHVMLLPRRSHLVLDQADWSLGAFSRLVSVLPSERGLLWLVLFSDATSEYVVASVQATSSQRRVRVYQDTRTTMPLQLASVSNRAIVYWQRVDATTRQLLSLRLSFGPLEPYHIQLCLVAESSTAPGGRVIQAASLFEDQVFTRVLDTASDERQFLRQDLNKDNDGVWDVADAFPLIGFYVWDSDNDEIGDEGDFIPFTGACVSSGVRGECPSDNEILYLVWGVYAMLSLSIVLIYRLRKLIYRRRHLALERELAGSESDEDIYNSGDDIDNETAAAAARLRQEMLEEHEARMQFTAEKLEQSIRHPIRFLGLFTEFVLLLLTVVSLVISIYPWYSYELLSLGLENQLVWIDFFIAFLFYLDLGSRYLFRNRRKYPGFVSFFKANWYDFPALITDVPEVTTLGAVRLVGAARLFGLFRILRVFKVVRVLRIYRRLTNRSLFVSMIVSKPIAFLSSMMMGVVFTAALTIKIVEQRVDENWSDPWRVIWFCIVTLTTTGYGDEVPVHFLSRIVAILLMFFGIAVIGILSARIGRNLLTVGATKSRPFSLEDDPNQRSNFKRDLLLISSPYNPIHQVLESFVRTMRLSGRLNRASKSKRRHKRPVGSVGSRRSIASAHSPRLEVRRPGGASSSALLAGPSVVAPPPPKYGHAPAADDAGSIATADLTSQGSRVTVDSHSMTDAALTAPEVSPVLRQRSGSVLRTPAELAAELAQAGEAVTPMFKLIYLLRAFHLDTEIRGVADFNELVDELAASIFDGGGGEEYKSFLEKAFALREYLKENPRTAELPRLVDRRDPILGKFSEIRETLERHGVGRRTDFYEIYAELQVLTVLYDRVRATEWALASLQFRPDARVLPPPLTAAAATTSDRGSQRRGLFGSMRSTTPPSLRRRVHHSRSATLDRRAAVEDVPVPDASPPPQRRSGSRGSRGSNDSRGRPRQGS